MKTFDCKALCDKARNDALDEAALLCNLKAYQSSVEMFGIAMRLAASAILDLKKTARHSDTPASPDEAQRSRSPEGRRLPADSRNGGAAPHPAQCSARPGAVMCQFCGGDIERSHD